MDKFIAAGEDGDPWLCKPHRRAIPCMLCWTEHLAAVDIARRQATRDFIAASHARRSQPWP